MTEEMQFPSKSNSVHPMHLDAGGPPPPPPAPPLPPFGAPPPPPGGGVPGAPQKTFEEEMDELKDLSIEEKRNKFPSLSREAKITCLNQMEAADLNTFFSIAPIIAGPMMADIFWSLESKGKEAYFKAYLEQDAAKNKHAAYREVADKDKEAVFQLFKQQFMTMLSEFNKLDSLDDKDKTTFAREIKAPGEYQLDSMLDRMTKVVQSIKSASQQAEMMKSDDAYIKYVKPISKDDIGNQQSKVVEANQKLEAAQGKIIELYGKLTSTLEQAKFENAQVIEQDWKNNLLKSIDQYVATSQAEQTLTQNHRTEKDKEKKEQLKSQLESLQGVLKNNQKEMNDQLSDLFKILEPSSARELKEAHEQYIQTATSIHSIKQTLEKEKTRLEALQAGTDDRVETLRGQLQEKVAALNAILEAKEKIEAPSEELLTEEKVVNTDIADLKKRLMALKSKIQTEKLKLDEAQKALKLAQTFSKQAALDQINKKIADLRENEHSLRDKLLKTEGAGKQTILQTLLLVKSQIKINENVKQDLITQQASELAAKGDSIAEKQATVDTAQARYDLRASLQSLCDARDILGQIRKVKSAKAQAGAGDEEVVEDPFIAVKGGGAIKERALAFGMKAFPITERANLAAFFTLSPDDNFDLKETSELETRIKQFLSQNPDRGFKDIVAIAKGKYRRSVVIAAPLNPAAGINVNELSEDNLEAMAAKLAEDPDQLEELSKGMSVSIAKIMQTAILLEPFDQGALEALVAREQLRHKDFRLGFAKEGPRIINKRFLDYLAIAYPSAEGQLNGYERLGRFVYGNSFEPDNAHVKEAFVNKINELLDKTPLHMFDIIDVASGQMQRAHGKPVPEDDLIFSKDITRVEMTDYQSFLDGYQAHLEAKKAAKEAKKQDEEQRIQAEALAQREAELIARERALAEREASEARVIADAQAVADARTKERIGDTTDETMIAAVLAEELKKALEEAEGKLGHALDDAAKERALAKEAIEENSKRLAAEIASGGAYIDDLLSKRTHVQKPTRGKPGRDETIQGATTAQSQTARDLAQGLAATGRKDITNPNEAHQVQFLQKLTAILDDSKNLTPWHKGMLYLAALQNLQMQLSTVPASPLKQFIEREIADLEKNRFKIQGMSHMQTQMDLIAYCKEVKLHKLHPEGFSLLQKTAQSAYRAPKKADQMRGFWRDLSEFKGQLESASHRYLPVNHPEAWKRFEKAFADLMATAPKDPNQFPEKQEAFWRAYQAVQRLMPGEWVVENKEHAEDLVKLQDEKQETLNELIQAKNDLKKDQAELTQLENNMQRALKDIARIMDNARSGDDDAVHGDLLKAKQDDLRDIQAKIEGLKVSIEASNLLITTTEELLNKSTRDIDDFIWAHASVHGFDWRPFDRAFKPLIPHHWQLELDHAAPRAIMPKPDVVLTPKIENAQKDKITELFKERNGSKTQEAIAKIRSAQIESNSILGMLGFKPQVSPLENDYADLLQNLVNDLQANQSMSEHDKAVIYYSALDAMSALLSQSGSSAVRTYVEGEKGAWHTEIYNPLNTSESRPNILKVNRAQLNAHIRQAGLHAKFPKAYAMVQKYTTAEPNPMEKAKAYWDPIMTQLKTLQKEIEPNHPNDWKAFVAVIDDLRSKMPELPQKFPKEREAFWQAYQKIQRDIPSLDWSAVNKEIKSLLPFDKQLQLHLVEPTVMADQQIRESATPVFFKPPTDAAQQTKRTAINDFLEAHRKSGPQSVEKLLNRHQAKMSPLMNLLQETIDNVHYDASLSADQKIQITYGLIRSVDAELKSLAANAPLRAAFRDIKDDFYRRVEASPEFQVDLIDDTRKAQEAFIKYMREHTDKLKIIGKDLSKPILEEITKITSRLNKQPSSDRLVEQAVIKSMLQPADESRREQLYGINANARSPETERQDANLLRNTIDYLNQQEKMDPDMKGHILMSTVDYLLSQHGKDKKSELKPILEEMKKDLDKLYIADLKSAKQQAFSNFLKGDPTPGPAFERMKATIEASAQAKAKGKSGR